MVLHGLMFNMAQAEGKKSCQVGLSPIVWQSRCHAPQAHPFFVYP